MDAEKLAVYEKILIDIIAADEEEDLPPTSTYTLVKRDKDTEAYRSFVKFVEASPTPIVRPRLPILINLNLKRKRKRKEDNDKDTSNSIRVYQFSGKASVDGIKDIDQKILHYLQQPAIFGKEKGVHRDELVQHLKVPLEKILESIRSLVEGGVIHSTIDDCHYKSTVNG